MDLSNVKQESDGDGCGGMKGCKARNFDPAKEDCRKCEIDAYEAMAESLDFDINFENDENSLIINIPEG